MRTSLLSTDLGLTLARSKGVRLFPQASAGWDFARGTYKNAAGYVRTNYAWNSQASGAASGTPPTGWQVFGFNGLTATVVGPTTVNGKPGVAVRWQGTPTTSGINAWVFFGPANGSPQTPASNGQTWTASLNVGVVSGSLSTATNANFGLRQLNGGTALTDLVTNVIADISATPRRVWSTQIINNASTNGVTGLLGLAFTSGTPVDVTLALALPQVERVSYPTSEIYTSSSGGVSVTTFSSTNPADVGNMTFTRASSGYAEDASGNLVLFGPNVPRITNKGVLIEPAATNLLLQSQALGKSPWVAFNISSSNPTVTNNAALAPDGTMTATQIDFPAVSVWQISALRQALTVTNPSTLAPSIYLRASSPVNMRMRQGNAAAGYTTIAVTTSWQRFEIPSGTTASTLFNFDILVGDTNSSGAVTVYAWGAQLETGSVATSYIPTTSTSATRAADVFYYSGASVASSFTLATAYWTANPTTSGAIFPISSLGSSYNNVAALYRRDVSSGYQGLVRQGGSAVADMIAGGAPTSGAHTLALRVSTNAFALARDGGIVATDTLGTAPTLSLDRLAIGTEAWSPGSIATTGFVTALGLYPFAASDAQLQTISSGQF